MGKIPVLQTITETYAFAFRRYFPILGALWLPFLLIMAASYYILLPALTLMVTFLADIAQHALQNPQTPYLPPSLWPMMRGLFLFEFVVLLIFPVIAVGVTKEALQMRRGPWFVYLAIGKPELLVLGGIFTLIALYFGAVIVIAIASGIIAIVAAMITAGAAHGDPSAGTATTLMIVRVVMSLFYLALLYFVIRLTFLMVPVSTAEGRFGLWRSWALTKGNFWRSIGVVLGTFLPVMIVTYGLLYAVFGSGLFQYMWDAQVRSQAAPAELGAQIRMLVSQAMFIGIYALAIAPINYGLMFGQSAFAYRALAGDKAAGPWGKS